MLILMEKNDFSYIPNLVDDITNYLLSHCSLSGDNLMKQQQKINLKVFHLFHVFFIGYAYSSLDISRRLSLFD